MTDFFKLLLITDEFNWFSVIINLWFCQVITVCLLSKKKKKEKKRKKETMFNRTLDSNMEIAWTMLKHCVQ